MRGKRGIWDLDLIVCFADASRLRRLFRRRIVCWDWGPSKFGRCPYDPSEYTGRAVDVKYWVIPSRRDPVIALQEWLAERLAKHPYPNRHRDVAHEPIVLIRPRLGEIAWDPDRAPRLLATKDGHSHRPVGLAPP